MKIMLASDGSEYSDEAARFLTRLALTPEDEVVVFHCLSEIPYEDDFKACYAVYKATKQGIAPKILDSALKVLKPVKAKIKTLAVEGYPETTIVSEAMERDVDLIVMGSRGLRGARALFVGSATRAIAINSPKPVLVIKLPLRETEGPLEVLLAIDGSGCSDAACGFLAHFPFPKGSRLSVLHIRKPTLPDIPAQFRQDIEGKLLETVRELKARGLAESEDIIEQATTRISSRFSGNVASISRDGDPASEILETADKINPDMIVLGSRGLKGVKGMLGSVARDVLSHSSCSVLICKREQSTAPQ